MAVLLHHVATPASARRSRERGVKPCALSSGQAPGGCPLRVPRHVKRGWRRELDFGVDPGIVQDELFSGSDVKLASGNWMTMKALFVGDSALARDVLATQADAFDVSTPPHFVHLLGRDNIGLLDEPAHGQVRGLMAPAFAPARVASHAPRVASLCQRYVRRWAAAGGVRRWNEDIKLLTFEVICSIVGGFDWSEPELREYSEAFAAIVRGMAFPIPLKLFGLTPFGKGVRARKKMEALLRGQFAKYRAIDSGGASSSPAAPPSLLQVMLSARDADGQPLSEAALLDNFIGLLIAGHDTTASSLACALFHLAQSPDAMAGLREEQDAIMRRHGNELTPAALADMPFAEAVLREAWRLHPVVPVVGRAAARDVDLGGFAISKGTRTFVALNTVTRGTAWDSLPETSPMHISVFDPRRWLTQEGAQAAAAQLPFGAGPRMCLGAALAMTEAKSLLAVVARELDFSVDAAAAVWTAFPFLSVAMDAQCAQLRR